MTIQFKGEAWRGQRGRKRGGRTQERKRTCKRDRVPFSGGVRYLYRIAPASLAAISRDGAPPVGAEDKLEVVLVPAGEAQAALVAILSEQRDYVIVFVILFVVLVKLGFFLPSLVVDIAPNGLLVRPRRPVERSKTEERKNERK